MRMLRVGVTGATGFVARALFSHQADDVQFVAISRQAVTAEKIIWRPGPDLSASTDWRPVLEGIDSLVHLAGRVHLAPDKDASAYFAENCAGTVKLAEDAAAVGVRRFVFLSSAKVLGDESGNEALAESAPVCPGDNYAESKLAAERGLAALGGAMRFTILRPPLVYGPGVKANFLALLSAVARGLPMPLASIQNRRSLIGVDNLAAVIVACIRSTKSEGRVYHVTDGMPLSSPDLVRAIASALGKPPRLFAFPVRMLEACGAAMGRAETIKRLTRSLELDDSAIRTELGWRPIRTFKDGIADTARWYKSVYGEVS
jgi:nucleoside-diphosphate-sugar epimerase